MNSLRFLRVCKCSILIVMMLFCLLVSEPAIAQTTPVNGQIRKPVQGLLGIHPLIRYARKVRRDAGGALLPCLMNATPPLCYSPQQIRSIYGVQPLLNIGIAGQGQTITIIDDYQNPTIRADVQLFDRIFGLSDPQLRILAPFGLRPFDPRSADAAGFALEIALDVEWAHVVAPGAKIDLVLGNPADDSLHSQVEALIRATRYAVNMRASSVISLSVGLGETCYSAGELQSWHTIFRRARNRFITVFASSGDEGSAVDICDRPGHAVSLGQGVNYPASDPLVSSVGGTTLYATRTGVYRGEIAWNGSRSGDGATGGGFSELFSRPAYQMNIPGIRQLRGIPDVAYNGDPLTGVPVVTSSFIPGQTIILPVGGTSAGTPQWAGISTLFDQVAGKHLGFLNGAFYRLSQSALYSAAFHDVIGGNNAFTLQNDQGRTVTIPGYEAGNGWDPATGVGSPRVATLSTLLPKYVASYDGDNL